MATLREALQFAKENPNDPKSIELRKRLESGSLNEMLRAEGFTKQFAPTPQVQLQAEAPVEQPSRFQETVQDIKQVGTSIADRIRRGLGKTQEIETARQAGEQGLLRSFGQQIGVGAGVVSGAIGDIFTGGVKAVLSPGQEEAVKAGLGKGIEVGAKTIEVGTSVLDQTAGRLAAVFSGKDFVAKDVNVAEVVQDIATFSKELKEKDPALARDLEAGLNVIMLALDVAGGAGAKVAIKKGLRVGAKTVQVGGEVAEATKKLATGAFGAITEKIPTAGVKQTTKELAERVPRALGKVGEFVEERAVRSVKISESTPAVANAITSNLDNRIINTVVDADAVTLKAYKEIVDLAETTGKKIGVKQRPEIIAGKAAEDQFSLIEKQRKKIGSQIGDEVDKLSKTVSVDMTSSYNNLADILKGQGIEVLPKGKLKFTGKFTPSERIKIQELYALAIEGGDKLTPRQVFDADRLFSKLQRETRLEGIGDLLIDTTEGTKSLFQTFREIFSKQLDISAPKIRALNRAYRKLLLLIDDIEKSIIKSGNFQTIKDVSIAGFAQTNLRRIFSDAGSAEAFSQIAKQMDILARKLGYKGATPEDLIAFAIEMRKLYPESIPATSFSGGIRTGVRDAFGILIKAGIPDIKDQQRALKALLEDLLK